MEARCGEDDTANSGGMLPPPLAKEENCQGSGVGSVSAAFPPPHEGGPRRHHAGPSRYGWDLGSRHLDFVSSQDLSSS